MSAEWWKIGSITFQGSIFIKKKAEIDHLPQNNHKHGSRPKDFNNKFDNSISSPPRDITYRHKPKVNSVRFEYPYNHINTMENNNNDNHLIDAHDDHTREDAEEDVQWG